MPGGNVCSVGTCNNNSKAAKKDGSFLRFFTFPKDPEVQKEWARRCNRQDKFDPTRKRICSRHFKPEDYEDRIKASLLNLQPKILKKDAVPSLFLNGEEEDPLRDTPQMLEREFIVPLENNIQDKVEFLVTLSDNENTDISKDSNVPMLKSDMRKRIKALEKQNYILKQKLLNLETSDKKMKEKIYELQRKLKMESLEFDEKVKLALKDIFTPNQVDIILKKKNKAHWTDKELHTAMTLRYFSKRTYIYLRQTLHYPLPGISTLEKWAGTTNLDKGVLGNILRIMYTSGKIRKNMKKVT